MGEPSVFVREFDEILMSSLVEDDEPTASSVEQVGQQLLFSDSYLTELEPLPRPQ